MRYFLIILLSIATSSCVFGPLGTSKRAMKQLEKSELDKADQLVNKALEKDSLLPAALYTKSRVLLAKNNYEYYDSAYNYILTAQATFDTLEVKSKQQHIKHAFDSLAYQQVKLTIDSLAFEHALEVNTEAGYNVYLENYPTAKQTLLAKSKRNALAFSKAKEVNTFESYKAFMEKYPTAVQVPEAERRYEKLYFDKSTEDGRVTSFIRFLEKNPETPYRREAEQKIFEVVTSEHSVGGYELFIDKYPSSHLRNKAINYAYHVAKETDNELPARLYNDSLRNAQALESHRLIAILEGEAFGFMKPSGEVIIKPRYQSIAPAYKCNSTSDDFLQVNQRLEGRDGTIITAIAYDAVEDLGYGLLKVKWGNEWGVIHKAGDKIIEVAYDQVKLLNGNILATFNGTDWTLQTVSGRLLVSDRCTDVYEQGGYIFFEKDELLEVKNAAALMRAVDSNPISFDYIFADYELLDDGNLWLQSAKGEMVVDKSLKEVIPFEKQQIKTLSNGLLIENEHGIYVLNTYYEPLIEATGNVRYNASWVVEKRDSTAIFLHISTNNKSELPSDSVQLLGKQHALNYHGDSLIAFFKNGTRQLLNPADQLTTIGKSDVEYMVARGNRNTRLYNAEGKEIFEPEGLDLTPIGNEYIITTKRGKKGIVSSKDGKVLLRPDYQAIGNYNAGSVSLLKGQKFGLYNRQTNTFIPAEYDKNIIVYNDSVYVAEEKEKIIFLTGKNKQLIEDSFDEIKYWNDTLAFVKNDKDWRLFNLKTKVLSNWTFQSYQEQSVRDSKLAVVLSDKKYGLLSYSSGMIIPATFNDILIFENNGDPIFFAEKHIEEAEFYVVIYYNMAGEIIRKQALEEDEYYKIYCD